MKISQRQRREALRLIEARRAQRGESPADQMSQVRQLKKRVAHEIQKLKREQRRLVQLARTPGFRSLLSAEEAQAAWAMPRFQPSA